MRAIIVFLSILLSGSLFAAASGDETPRTRSGAVLRSATLATAGRSSASETVHMNGTLGQPTPAGAGSSENFDLTAGYWAAPPILTAVPDGDAPAVYRDLLFSNVPNPFNPLTTLRFETSTPGRAVIIIYDIRGRCVRHLVDEIAAPGRYEAIWDGVGDDGRPAPSGIYLYRLETTSFSDVKKMVLIR